MVKKISSVSAAPDLTDDDDGADPDDRELDAPPADDHFNHEIEDNTGLDVEPPPRAVAPIPALFVATPEETRREEARKDDRKVGLLIGPKNLERLRAFGYDVLRVSEDSLTPGVAHRGLTE